MTSHAPQPPRVEVILSRILIGGWERWDPPAWPSLVVELRRLCDETQELAARRASAKATARANRDSGCAQMADSDTARPHCVSEFACAKVAPGHAYKAEDTLSDGLVAATLSSSRVRQQCSGDLFVSTEHHHIRHVLPGIHRWLFRVPKTAGGQRVTQAGRCTRLPGPNRRVARPVRNR